jgi:hypothetical protein
MISKAWIAASATVALCACSGYSPRTLAVGQGMAEVTADIGNPTGRYPLAEGATRLEFARGPYGKHTYMVDLDPQGRVTGWNQVLTEENFNEVRRGQTGNELLLFIGRPSERRAGGWQGGEVWSYRYETIMGLCQWFQVSLTTGGVVTDTAYGIDPRCDAGGKTSRS